MALEQLVAWGVSPSAKWAAAGAGLVAVFMCGRLSAPDPEPQVLCAPVLVRVQECLDDLESVQARCGERLVRETEEARSHERELCEERRREGVANTGRRACEVCRAQGGCK